VTAHSPQATAFNQSTSSTYSLTISVTIFERFAFPSDHV
jgi:hypothetical protein